MVGHKRHAVLGVLPSQYRHLQTPQQVSDAHEHGATAAKQTGFLSHVIGGVWGVAMGHLTWQIGVLQAQDASHAAEQQCEQHKQHEAMAFEHGGLQAAFNASGGQSSSIMIVRLMRIKPTQCLATQGIQASCKGWGHYSASISRVLSLDSHSSSNMIAHAVKQPTRIQCEPH